MTAACSRSAASQVLVSKFENSVEQTFFFWWGRHSCLSMRADSGWTRISSMQTGMSTHQTERPRLHYEFVIVKSAKQWSCVLDHTDALLRRETCGVRALSV